MPRAASPSASTGASPASKIASMRHGQDFEAFIAPRKGADDAALAEHAFQIAAQILGVQQSFLERVIVERKHVRADLSSGALVHVLERAEIIRRLLAHRLFELARDVRPHGADRRIHRMIARARIHAEPFDLLFQHPFERGERRPRVVAEIADEILLALPFVIFVPSGVQDEDVAGADIGARLFDHLRRDRRPILHLRRQIDHDALIDQKVERQRRHVAGASVGGMHGAVEMRAGVHRRLDPLRDDALRLQVLRVIHLVARVADPAGRMDAHGVREIDDLHRDNLVMPAAGVARARFRTSASPARAVRRRSRRNRRRAEFPAPDTSQPRAACKD